MAPNVLNKYWTQLYKTWTLCIGDLHVIDKANQELKCLTKLKTDIVALWYSTAANLDCLDKCLFSLPLEDCLRQESQEQAVSINVVTPHPLFDESR
jgi:hypothetical protein